MDGRVAQLEAAIEWLCEAAARNVDSQNVDSRNVQSRPPPRRLTESERVEAIETIERIHAAIHPRRLPPDIEWFWTTWKPDSFDPWAGHPYFALPDFALQAWLDEPDWPRALFWISYESHCFLGVELDYPGSPGPLLYADCYASGDGLRLRAPNLAAWIGVSAAIIDENPGVPAHEALADEEEFERRCGDALAANGLGPDQRGPYDWNDLLQCPERWRIQQGVDAETIALRGASCTISELNEARRRGPIEATIVGRMRTLAGTAEGRFVVVSDDTGRVEVWVPSTVPNLGDQQAHDFELDVVAEDLADSEVSFDDLHDDQIEMTHRALAGDLEGANEAMRSLGEFMSRPHPIVARAVRPIDPPSE